MKVIFEDLWKTIFQLEETQVRSQINPPDDYIIPDHIGFFSEEYDKDTFIRFGNAVANEKYEKSYDNTKLHQFLSGDLDKIDEVANDIGILDNNAQLLLHNLYHKHKVVKFQTKLEGLLYTRNNTLKDNNGVLLDEAGKHIFMISGLDQEVNFGGVKTYVTASELVPVSGLATDDMFLYTCSSDKLVTCYSVDNNIARQLDTAHIILKVGRFRFGNGKCKISTNDNEEEEDDYDDDYDDDDYDDDENAP